MAKTLAVSDRAYLPQFGVVVGEAPAATRATSDAVRRAFLGE